MHWNYRIIQTAQPDGEPWFAIHETYYNESGEPATWTCEPVALSGESVRDLIKDVAWILKGLTEPVLVLKDGKLTASDSTAEGK